MDILVIIGTLGALIAILQFLKITDVFKVWRWLSNLFNPRPVGPPRKDILDYSNLIADKTRGFVGRQFVFAAIDQFMANHPSGYFIVRGGPGIWEDGVGGAIGEDEKLCSSFQYSGRRD